jgi:hypothetical protein
VIVVASHWQPYREPFLNTLLRTGIIAVVVGLFAALSAGSFEAWPLAIMMMLWPAFGGHWVEIFFLNWLRPQLSNSRAVQAAARVAVWFVGGSVLGAGMRLTTMALGTFRPGRELAWWIPGVAFIGIELMAHLALQLRGLPSFYNGRG